MKKICLSPALIVVLAVLSIFAVACNRPDPQAALETPQPMTVPQQGTPGAEIQQVSGSPTPTLPVVIATAEAGVATLEPGAEQPQPTGAPTTQPAQPAQPTQTPQPQAATTSSGNQAYTVKPGDTLFSIGRLYNVNPYAIAAANNIPYPYIIYPGQQLIIPTGTTPPGPYPTPVPPSSGGCRYYHLVRPGENLFRISLAYGVPMSTIAAANGISNYNLIYAGQTLCIP